MKKIIAVFVLALAVLVSVHPAEVQAAEMRRIGLLTPRSPSDSAPWYEAFRQGLRKLGWVEGKNIHIEYRYARGKRKRLPGLASELVRLKVELIVILAGYTLRDIRRASNMIPVVMAVTASPFVGGYVKSLARPGGNVTGLSEMTNELSGKRMELLKEIVPGLSRVAVIWNPKSKPSARARDDIMRVAQGLGVRTHPLEVRSNKNIGKAIEEASRAGANGLIFTAGVTSGVSLKWVAGLAAKHWLPMIFHVKRFAEAGGLVSYAPDRADLYRRAAAYVNKILKGAKPGDIPIEQPRKFDLIINLKTAKKLGITIPPEVLFQATKVIK